METRYTVSVYYSEDDCFDAKDVSSVREAHKWAREQKRIRPALTLAILYRNDNRIGERMESWTLR